MENSILRPDRPRFIYIPNTLASWPWPRSINPYYDICKAESSRWCESFGAFDKSAQEAFNKCDFNLLASMAYPSLDKGLKAILPDILFLFSSEGCRIGCDLMNLFFVIDEHTDKATADVVQTQADIVMDALYRPHNPRPKGEWVGGEVARQFWANAICRMTLVAQHRFINTFQAYLDAVVEQAKDRTAHRVRTIESYFQVRRETIGAKPSFALNEMYMNIPNHVMSHPVIEQLSQLSIDLIIIGNDLCSYSREQAQGDVTHNLVTIVMHELNTDIQSGINWIGHLHERLLDQFLKEWHNIPTVTLGLPERSRKDIHDYCQSLANWVRGNDSWSFESERYFGKVGRQVQNTRWVQLLPRLHTISTSASV